VIGKKRGAAEQRHNSSLPFRTVSFVSFSICSIVLRSSELSDGSFVCALMQIVDAHTSHDNVTVAITPQQETPPGKPDATLHRAKVRIARTPHMA